jgi:hypothetical protein
MIDFRLTLMQTPDARVRNRQRALVDAPAVDLGITGAAQMPNTMAAGVLITSRSEATFTASGSR